MRAENHSPAPLKVLLMASGWMNLKPSSSGQDFPPRDSFFSPNKNLFKKTLKSLTSFCNLRRYIYIYVTGMKKTQNYF